MDKDEHFKLLDSLCWCSLDQLFDSSNFKEELILLNSNEIDLDNQSDLNLHETNQLKDANLKPTDLEKLINLKNHPNFLDELIYSHENLRENEQKHLELIILYLNKIIGSEEKYFSRKLNLFSKMICSYYTSKKSINKLEFNYEPLIQQYSLMPNFSLKSVPGLKPLSTWPISLGDLWNKLKTIKLEELFNQPILESFKEEFYSEGIKQIINFDNSNDIPNLSKAICCFLCILILFGDYLLLFKGIITLRTTIKNKNKLDESVFTDKDNPLFLKINELLKILEENDFNLYPIMRNYSIVDYFSVNKSFLYIQTKSTFFNSCSCCTDGTYLYILMNGIDGYKLKIGTGFNNTIKGKIYLSIHNKEDSVNEYGDYGNQWVYCNGKIYQKLNRPTSYFESSISLSYKNSIGLLNVINPENFKIEKRIRLLFPQNALNDLIANRNQNYVLLSDGKKLSVLCLELAKNNDKINNNKQKINTKDDDLLYKYINLELIEYDTNNLNYNSEEYQAKISPKNKQLVEEIYTSFSLIFTKEECFKALLKNNWNPKETALYLIDNPSEIKQSFLIGEKPVILFQSKIESQNIKSGGKCEFKFYNNTYFDCYHYDNLKWALDGQFIIGYKINEGAAAIFGRDPDKYGHIFKFEIENKKLNNNESSFPFFFGSKNKVFPKYKKLDSDLKESYDIKDEYELLKKYAEENKDDKLFTSLIEFEANLIKLGEEKQSNKIKKENSNDIEKNDIKNQNETNEEKIFGEVYGTLIKKTSSISFSKNNYILTYDSINKIYYIIFNTFSQLNSLSILVCDTFNNMNLEYKKLFNFKNENFLQMKNFFNTALLGNQKKENELFNFDNITDQILNILYLVSSSMKYDIFWRYKNWSFYYNYLLEFINNRYQEVNNNIDANFYLFPIFKEYPISKKSLNKRIDKFNDANKELLIQQLDKELNENYKLKEIPEIENTRKYSMYNASPNKKHIGNWVSGTTLMFKYKYQKDKKGQIKEENEKLDENIKSYALSYANKRIYLTNKRIFFLGIKGDLDEINYILEIMNKKRNNDNYIDFISKELLFKLIYLWISNIDNTLILTNKKEYKNEINELKNLLKEFYTDNSCDDKIKNLIRLIIIEGWNELATSIEEQIYWFKEFYSFNKNTEEKEIIAQNDFNLEYYTLLFYEKYPFYCLSKKLDFTRNSLCINNNFNKINCVKSFNFYPIIYKKKYRLVALPAFHGLSSINLQIPFYWFLLNFSINYFQEEIKEKIKPIIIDIDYKGAERYSPPYKGVVVDYKLNKISKLLYEQIHINSSLLLYKEFIKNEEIKIDYESLNKEMWEFYNINYKDNKLINLLNKFLILCFGEIISLYKNYQTIIFPFIDNNESSLLSKFRDFGYNKKDSINKIIYNKVKENSEEEEKRFELREKFKINYISFFENLKNYIEKFINLFDQFNDNFELLKLNCNYLYFIFHGIKNYIFNNDENNLKLLLSSLRKVNNYEINELLLNNELGNIYSNSRVFEYYLSNSDLVNIGQTISFNNNNELFCVELELQLINNERLLNKDILIISNYHGYKNSTFYVNNYFNSYGTSFSIKLNRSFKKVLFLKGTEIKIISPGDNIRNRIASGNENNKKNADNYLNQLNNKSFLKIKVYPYNNHSLTINKDKNIEIIDKRIKNISLSIITIEEIEYYLSYIFKKIIKSTDFDKKEDENILTKFDILKLGLKEEFYKTIDENFEKEKNNYKKNKLDDNKIDFIKKFLETEKASSLISLKNSKIDTDLYIYKLILNRIRKVLKEPISYSNIKKFPSFNGEIKLLWEKVEILLLYAFLYHLNLLNDFKDAITNNESDTIDNALELILGKRLNIIMSFMANKALLFKDSFDLIKNFLYDYETEFNNSYEDIKQIVIKDIYKIDKDKLFEEKEDNKISNLEDNKISEKKEKKKIDKLVKLKEKFGSKDDVNYKKKKNAPRTLYQEKKKKKPNKNTEKEKKNNIEEEKLKKRNEEKEKYNNLNSKTLEQLINESSIQMPNEINDKIKTLKNLLSTKYKNLIKDEIHSRYFGNKEKLKSICEIYKIDYNDNNPNESMDKYSLYIYNEVANLIKDNNTLNKIEINEKGLSKKNPFIYLADKMIYKISLLINLNNYNENNENEEFNIQLTERMKSFSGSFNLALQSNNSSSFQNYQSNKNTSTNQYPDENLVLDPKNLYILKSLVHYIIKYENNVNNAIVILYTQYIRSNTRILGIKNLSDYFKKDLKGYTNYNYGLLSLAVGKYKTGLLNGIESNNKVMNNIKNDLIILIENYINKLIISIKEFENENTNLNDNNKIIINLSKEEIDNNYNKYYKENNPAYYLIKKIILILSDIQIILSYISSHKHLFEDDFSNLNLEKFIDIIFNILMNKKKNKINNIYNNETEKIKRLIKEIIKIILDEIILLNNQKNTDFIFGQIYEYLNTSKEKSIKKNILELLRNILLNYNKVNQNNNNINFNLDSNIIKIYFKLFEFIEKTNSPEIINISSQIIISIYKSISQTGKKEINNLLVKDIELLFKKIGKLFMFDDNHSIINNNIKEKDDDLSVSDDNYYIIIEMNSTEMEYQFLVNALFYWEEKYPTELSKYKFEEDNVESKEKKENENKDIKEKKTEYNEMIRAENNYNIKLFNYFNMEKGEKGKIIHKMTKLYRIVDEKLEKVRKNIDISEKAVKDPNTKEEDKNKINEQIKAWKKNQKYYDRIKAHIKTAEEIGEIATIKGYVILLPKLPHKKAKELCELLYKSYNRLLEHFKSEIGNDKNETLFNDQIIYPPLPKQNNLLAGLTTTLKETTRSNLNLTLITEKEYNIISETYDYFSKEIQNNKVLDKNREKFGKYNDNYMLNVSKVVINSVDFNSYNKKIIDEENILSGKCITIIIQSIIELLYNIYSLNTSIILKLIRAKFKQIKADFNTKNSKGENLVIIGMLLYINNYYNIIRLNTKVTNSNKKDNESKLIGKVINGGDKSGSNICKVCFIKKSNNINQNKNYSNLKSSNNNLTSSYNNSEEDLSNKINYKIENVNINSLNKLDENEDLIKYISLNEVFELFLIAFDNYKNCQEFDNQILLQLSLKLLNIKNIEKEEIIKFWGNNKNIINKVLENLIEISNKANWIEKNDRFWESEFIESFERLQDKFNIDKKNLLGIYSPIFYNINSDKDLPKEEKKENLNQKNIIKNEDLISNYNISKSEFILELPQLKDYSKIVSSMRNIIIFERYFAGEIYNYAKQQYSEIDYMNALCQIRYQISIGDLNGLKNDMSNVFDNGKIPITGLLFREQFDTNEIFAQEIYPNNYYCARINKTDTPVLILLQDYSISQCLCLIFDDYKGRMFTQWINNEDLKLLSTSIKIPSFSFNYNELIKEYNYLEKKLRILYSKNALFDIVLPLLNKNEFEIPLKNNNNLFELELNNWKKYKLNPISGVFKDFNNYILMKNNPKIEKLLSMKFEQNNLNELINNSLVESDNNEDNKIIVKNTENKINENKKEKNKNWVIKEWENLSNNLKTITVNLYTDYIEKSNILFNTSKGNNLFHLSNYNNKLLALHELVKLESQIDESDICGIIITFNNNAKLEANAKLTFYSDPYGENIIGEISSFKTITNNLPTYIFNYPKVWLKYTPGTRCFYIYEWDTVPIGSDLPCIITAIPYNWSLLIQLTDTLTNDLFIEEQNNKDDNNNLKEYKNLIHLLINHCTSNKIPSEIQRRIFIITTRTLFKYKQYLKLNGNVENDIIEDKIDLISTDKGKDLVELIKKVEKTSENKVDNKVNYKYFSSYVVEGVEIILAILSIIKGKNIDINTISKYLKEKFDYSLPNFIVAIDKLNQCIDYINNSNENNLENGLIEEIKKENDLINFIYNNIIIIKVKEKCNNLETEKKEEKLEEKKEDEKEEIKKEKKEEKNIIKEEEKNKRKKSKSQGKGKDKKDDKKIKDKDNKIKQPEENENLSLRENIIKILKENEAIVVNSDYDILEFDFNNEGKNEKYIGIALDGFILSDKNLKTEKEKEEEQKKKVEEEDPLWKCYYCSMENDKSNSFCVFCDKDKKVLPKEKPKSKEEEIQNGFGPPNNYDMVLKYNEKKMENLKKKLKGIKNNPIEEIYCGEDIINLPNYPGPLNNYLNERFTKYRNNKDYYSPKISKLKKLNEPNIEEIVKKLSNEDEIKMDDIFDLTMDCFSSGIDFWFDFIDVKNLLNKEKIKKIDLSLLTKISEVIDNSIISNQLYNKMEDYILILPSNHIRCIDPSFLNFNQISNFKDLNEIPLNILRYYWSIIKHYNNCLKTSLPYIKPPSTYKTVLKNSIKNDYILVPLHETISTFLTNNRGLIFNSIKMGLLNSIIDSSEFSEEEIQIPEMKFERLEVASNIDKKKNEITKIMINNINYTDVVSDDQRINNLNIKNLLKNNLNDKDSLFLQAFNQYKYYDISSYRSKRFPGDPKIAFKVIFKNEFVQGLGGPYRQFFSDISKELNEYLPLLIETQNNINNKGEYKDCYTINPGYKGINALEQYEFLGVLMGICIRTGVHLTLDLCSLVWKLIANEKIDLEDIFQYDEGIYNIIKTIYYYGQNKDNKEKEMEKKENNAENINDIDGNPINKEKEELDNIFNYNTILTDGTVKYFDNNIKEKKELILNKSSQSERIKYISMLLYNRLNESEIQINSIRNGLSKIIPFSVLQLFTGKELSMLVCGRKEVDIDLLHQNTKLSSELTENTKEVRWLWEILHEMNSEEKIKFIKFCWAQERLPSSNEEYIKNQIEFTIKSNKNEKNKNGFPRADTCFFNLELPNYTSKDIMKKNLLIAIGLDNNSMNADKITGINSANINSNQRGNNRDRDDYERDDDYDNYDNNYQMESCDEEGYLS